jgi:hypothetical protein
MFLFLILILLFCVFQALFLSLSVGLGYLLHWLIPGMEIGPAIIVGVVANVAALYVAVQFVRSYWLLPHSISDVEDDDFDEDDDDFDDDEDEEADDKETEIVPPNNRRSSKTPAIGKHWKSKQ